MARAREAHEHVEQQVDGRRGPGVRPALYEAASMGRRGIRVGLSSSAADTSTHSDPPSSAATTALASDPSPRCAPPSSSRWPRPWLRRRRCPRCRSTARTASRISVSINAGMRPSRPVNEAAALTRMQGGVLPEPSDWSHAELRRSLRLRRSPATPRRGLLAEPESLLDQERLRERPQLRRVPFCIDLAGRRRRPDQPMCHLQPQLS